MLAEPHDSEGLTALARQRWLVQEERKAVLAYMTKGTALNEADPEIVETAAAVEEYEISNKPREEAISAERRTIRAQIATLEQVIVPEKTCLGELRMEQSRCQATLKWATGWRRIVRRRPKDFDLQAETSKLGQMGAKINRISQKIEHAEAKVQELRTKDKEFLRRLNRSQERLVLGPVLRARKTGQRYIEF